MKHHGPLTRLASIITLAAIALGGCATTQEAVPAANSPPVMIRNEGYSLLYELAGKQKDVGKLLLVKKVSPPVAGEIETIEQIFKQAYDQLNAFAQQDAQLKFGVTHLPVIEQKTRDSIESQTKKDLLLSSGREFETQLLILQVKALQYAAHLARTIDAQEDNRSRKQFLGAFAKQCDEATRKMTALVGKP